MGYSQTLKKYTIDEWKDYYLDYTTLKQKAKKSNKNDEYFQDFKNSLYEELSKVNKFYFLLETKAVDEKNKIFNNFESKETLFVTDDIYTGKNTNKDKATSYNDINLRKSKTTESGQSMMGFDGLADFINIGKGFSKRKKEKHVTEFLHSLINIKSYRDINTSGFIGIAKIANQTLDGGRKNNGIKFIDWFMEKLKKNYFYKSRRISSIKKATKKMYKNMFAKDQPKKAKGVFRRLSRGKRANDTLYLLSGVFIGISSVLSIIYNLNYKSNVINAINNIFIGFILFGLSAKVFKNNLVNYKFIFNFDMASTMSDSSYLFMVSLMLLFNNLIFYIMNTKWLLPYSGSIPGILLVIYFFVLFNPFNILFLNSRIYLISVLSRAILLPTSTIRFRHFYFIDFLQTFKYSIVETSSYFLNENNTWIAFLIFSLFPIIRILQCLKRYSTSRLAFPHLINAFKYCMAVACVLMEIIRKYPSKDEVGFNFLDPYESILKYITAIFSFFWDVLIDWAIYRNRFMFPKKFYLFAIIFNFLVKAHSVLSSFETLRYLRHPVLASILEIFRRCLWTLIRVEVEHLNNCHDLKSNKAINLTAGELFYKKDIADTTIDPFAIETETDCEEEYRNRFVETSEDDLNFTRNDDANDYSVSTDQGSYHMNGIDDEFLMDSMTSIDKVGNDNIFNDTDDIYDDLSERMNDLLNDNENQKILDRYKLKDLSAIKDEECVNDKEHSDD